MLAEQPEVLVLITDLAGDMVGELEIRENFHGVYPSFRSPVRIAVELFRRPNAPFCMSSIHTLQDVAAVDNIVHDIEDMCGYSLSFRFAGAQIVVE